ncbi:hypothetical protein BDY19DRAFT_902122 [Irpex rosettiformis]|uniref:Uncharacterized protein n=1 Tax=Irpex rosettiformis TaxID=378272 RepID=A0ACB8UKX5_9APHY|nr:hypothetical protein BDY19DRAFT_902122 [Irpex rosettiformis]
MSAPSSSTPVLRQDTLPPSYESVVSSSSQPAKGWPLEVADNALYEVEESETRGEVDESQFLAVLQAYRTIQHQLYVAIIKAASDCRASLDDMEDLMLSGARILDTELNLLRMRGTITCLVGSRTAGWELKIEYRSSARSGASNTDGLRAIRDILDAVAAEAITVAKASEGLNEVVEEHASEFPIRNPIMHLCIAALVSTVVYAALSHGAIMGASISALGTTTMSIAQVVLDHHYSSHAKILELLIIIMTSLIAHDSRITAVGVVTLVSTLPGYIYICNVIRHPNDDLLIILTKSAIWTIYVVLLGFGFHILVDVVLLYNLLALVICVQDMLEGVRGLLPRRHMGRLSMRRRS